MSLRLSKKIPDFSVITNSEIVPTTSSVIVSGETVAQRGALEDKEALVTITESTQKEYARVRFTVNNSNQLILNFITRSIDINDIESSSGTGLSFPTGSQVSITDYPAISEHAQILRGQTQIDADEVDDFITYDLTGVDLTETEQKGLAKPARVALRGELNQLIKDVRTTVTAADNLTLHFTRDDDEEFDVPIAKAHVDLVSDISNQGSGTIYLRLEPVSLGSTDRKLQWGYKLNEADPINWTDITGGATTAVTDALSARIDALEQADTTINQNIATAQSSIQTLTTKLNNVRVSVSGNTLTITDPEGTATSFTAQTSGGGGTTLTPQQLAAINSIASLTTRLTTAETAITNLQADVLQHQGDIDAINQRDYVESISAITNGIRVVFVDRSEGTTTAQDFTFGTGGGGGGTSLTPEQLQAIANVATLMTQVATLQTEVNKLKPTLVSAIPGDLSTLIPDRVYTLPSGDSFYVKTRQGHAEYPLRMSFTNADLSNTGAVIQGFIKPNINFSSIPNVSSSTSTIDLPQSPGTIPAYIDAILIFKQNAGLDSPADIGILWNKQTDGSLTAPSHLTLRVDFFRLGVRYTKERRLNNFRENSNYALYFSSNVYTDRDAEFFEIDATAEATDNFETFFDILLPDNTSVVPDGTETFYDVVNLQTGELNYEYGSAEMPRAVVGKRLYDTETGDEYLGVEESSTGVIVEPVKVSEKVYGLTPNTRNATSRDAGADTILLDLNEDKEELEVGGIDTLTNWRKVKIRDVNGKVEYTNPSVAKPAGTDGDDREENKRHISLRNFSEEPTTTIHYDPSTPINIFADGRDAQTTISSPYTYSPTTPDFGAAAFGFLGSERRLFVSAKRTDMPEVDESVSLYGINLGISHSNSLLHYISAHGSPDGGSTTGTSPTGMEDNGIAELRINAVGAGYLYLPWRPETGRKLRLYMKKLDNDNDEPVVNLGYSDVIDNAIDLTANGIFSLTVGTGASSYTQKYARYTFTAAPSYFGQSDFLPSGNIVQKYGVAIIKTSANNKLDDAWFNTPPEYLEVNGIKIPVTIKHSGVVFKRAGTNISREGSRDEDDDLLNAWVQYYCESGQYLTSQLQVNDSSNGVYHSVTNANTMSIVGINKDKLYFSAGTIARPFAHKHPRNLRIPYEITPRGITDTDVLSSVKQPYWKLVNRAKNFEPTKKEDLPLPDAERLTITASDKNSIFQSLEVSEDAVIFHMRKVPNSANLMSDYVNERYQLFTALSNQESVLGAWGVYITNLVVDEDSIKLNYYGDGTAAQSFFARIKNLTTNTYIGALIDIPSPAYTQVSEYRQMSFAAPNHGIEAGDFIAIYFSNADETQQLFRSPPTIIWRQVGHPVKLGNRYLKYEELARGRVNVTTANRFVLFNPTGSATSFDLSNYDEDDVLEFHVQEWTISLQQYSQIGSVRVGEIFDLPRSSANSPIATTGAADSIRFRVDGRNVSIGWDTQNRLLVTSDNTSRDPDPLIIYRPYISV